VAPPDPGAGGCTDDEADTDGWADAEADGDTEGWADADTDG
jgi:hypothetical protein